MNHPEDMTAFLKAKLEDRNPKCGNCRHWRPRLEISNVGACNYGDPGSGVIAAVVTTDLSLCSAWEKKPE